MKEHTKHVDIQFNLIIYLSCIKDLSLMGVNHVLKTLLY